MKSTRSLDESSELLERIEKIKRDKTKLERDIELVTEELQELGFDLPEDAEEWFETAKKKIKSLSTKMEKEADIVRGKIVEYENNNE